MNVPTMSLTCHCYEQPGYAEVAREDAFGMTVAFVAAAASGHVGSGNYYCEVGAVRLMATIAGQMMFAYGNRIGGVAHYPTEGQIEEFLDWVRASITECETDPEIRAFMDARQRAKGD